MAAGVLRGERCHFGCVCVCVLSLKLVRHCVRRR